MPEEQPEVMEERLAWLCRSIERNRFLPMPPPELGFIGDGEYRAIGAEFLAHLVRLAGLKPGERVLDLGCGTGRIAVPLTQYLDEQGSYEGLDPVAAGIDWCSRTITPRYDSFRFQHLDVRHALYNPEGMLDAATVPLPFEDASFDLVLLTSVFTHIEPAQTDHYLAEIGRLLRPGGRCFATFFLLDDAVRRVLAEGASRIALDLAGAGPAWYMPGDAPLGAVAYDALWLAQAASRHGLVEVACRRGFWPSNQTGETFQDIWVATRGTAP